MGTRKGAAAERERLASSIRTSLGSGGGEYEMSTMFADRLRRRLIGTWKVADHTQGGRDFVESFRERTLRGADLLDAEYEATYEFRECLCVKRAEVSGTMDDGDGNPIAFRWVLNCALAWEPEPSGIRVRPEIGYQYSSLDGEVAAVRDLPRGLDWTRIELEPGDDWMEMREGDDVKKLARMP